MASNIPSNIEPQEESTQANVPLPSEADLPPSVFNSAPGSTSGSASSSIDTGDGSCFSALSITTSGTDAAPDRSRRMSGDNPGQGNRENARVPGTEVCAGEIEVRPATRMFESNDIYKMSSMKRGYCVIVNNLEFEGDPSKYRHGSKIEGELLGQLFTKLGFDVTELLNQSGEQMKATFKEYSEKSDQSACDCFIGVILTHGERDNLVHGSDNRVVEVEQLIDYFNNKNCPGLIDKPKMFFIQACRGVKRDAGVTLCSFDASHNSELPRSEGRILPTWSDTLICYSTVDGYVSSRNEVTGSWFGDALIRVFAEKACDTELNSMLIKVNNLLIEKEGSNRLKQSLEVVYRGWSKQLYFNPGQFREPVAISITRNIRRGGHNKVLKETQV